MRASRQTGKRVSLLQHCFSYLQQISKCKLDATLLLPNLVHTRPRILRHAKEFGHSFSLRTDIGKAKPGKPAETQFGRNKAFKHFQSEVSQNQS